MTDPNGQPAQPMPSLGRGGSWSAHIEGGMPKTEPYQPPPRTRPAGGWAKAGVVGASTNLSADETPVTVPARAYGSELARGAAAGPELEPAPPSRRGWLRRAIEGVFG